MILYAFFSLVFSAAYVALILWMKRNWARDAKTERKSLTEDLPYVSVIIVARNEADSIKEALASIFNNDYPEDKYEILLVDDHSEDDTVEIASSLDISNLSILHLKDYHAHKDSFAFKKRAIAFAISKATGSVILCTDADCKVPRSWIREMADAVNSGLWLATGPISYSGGKGLVHKFQKMEMMGLMSVTNAGVNSGRFFMANGANLAFSKAKFIELNGYDGNWQYASGDDMFLIDKWGSINASKVVFIKSSHAIVQTKSEENWTDFARQRIRWATKTAAYSNGVIKSILGFVFLFCCSIILNFCLGFYCRNFFYLFTFMLTVKSITDYYYLKDLSNFFDAKKSMKSYLVIFPIHIVYVVLSGIAGLLPLSFQWKGRTVK